jgi:hypothetical protein
MKRLMESLWKLKAGQYFIHQGVEEIATIKESDG